VAEVVHAVQFDLPQVQARSTGASAKGGLASWMLAPVLAVAIPLLIFGAIVILVRFDILRADTLTYAPPLGLIGSVLGVLWVLMRRR
jgi:hypothetical protein